MVRDELNKHASKFAADEIVSQKDLLITLIENDVRSHFKLYGIDIIKISLASSFRLPPMVEKALQNKSRAIQSAQEQKNKLRETQAKARKGSSRF